MNTQALSQHYEEFTPEERVRLILAAAVRKDIEEATRLMASCPQITLVGPDPEYPKLLDRVGIASANVLLCWLDVSHLVVRYRILVDASKLLALVCESPSRIDRDAEGEDAENPEAIVRECRAAGAKIKADYKSWSAVWKGIESAIARFCMESGLTVVQFFALTGPLSPAIEEARGKLDADAAANRAVRKGIYDQLRQAWFGDSKTK